MAARFKIYDLARLAGRTVFFDTNILIYLFWPSGNTHRENDYARFLSACLKNGIPRAIDFLVVSEAANRMLRLEWERHCGAHGLSKAQLPFKNYRESPEGQLVQSDVFAVLRRNIARFSICGKAFSAEDVFSFLEVDRLDMVDKAILSLCREKNFVLATHDADFAASSVDIVSANPAF